MGVILGCRQKMGAMSSSFLAALSPEHGRTPWEARPVQSGVSSVAFMKL